MYELNWGLKPTADVRLLAADPQRLVPNHSLLAGGFPCQPFSKSGRQLGVAEERGTLFQDVIRILAVKQPLSSCSRTSATSQAGAKWWPGTP